LSSLISMTDLPVEGEVVAATSPQATDTAPPASATPADIPIDQIHPNPHQPRRQFNDTTLAELAASLKTNGLIQPVIVRQTADGYQLIAGERRLRAAKLAGLSAVPAIVRDVDAFTQAQLALVENIHREDLNPIDRAIAYRALVQQLGLTQAELAQRLGEDRSTVANFLRLLDLAEPVRQLVRDGQLSLGHAKVLAGVADVARQDDLAKRCVSQGLSVRNLEQLVQNWATETEQPAKPTKQASPHLQDLEKTFARQLGMRVQIRAGKNKSKGKLIIHYGSLDQFDQLQERLGVKVDET
jgi:ParB family chromosome partitioning protein